MKKTCMLLALLPLLAHGTNNVVFLRGFPLRDGQLPIRLSGDNHEYKVYPAPYGKNEGQYGMWLESDFLAPESIVTIEITSVELIAITDINGLYFPTPWYRVECVVKKIDEGKFPYETFSFMVCYFSHNNWWPEFLSGFHFQMGFSHDNGVWTLESHKRVSSLPPHHETGFVQLWGGRSPFPALHTNQALRAKIDRILAHDDLNKEVRPSDISLEQGKYVVLAYPYRLGRYNFYIDFGGKTEMVVFDFDSEEPLYFGYKLAASVADYIEFSEASRKGMEEARKNGEPWLYGGSVIHDWLQNGKQFPKYEKSPPLQGELRRE